MTVLARVLLFASSYIPLCFLLAIRTWPQERVVAGSLALVGLVLIGLTWLLIEQLREGGREELVVTETQPRAESLSGYLVGYVLPFLILDVHDIYAVASVVGFLALVAWIHVSSGLLYLNPVLALRGYHVWEVQARRPDGLGAVSRMVLIADTPIMRPDQHFMTRPVMPGIRWAERIDAAV